MSKRHTNLERLAHKRLAAHKRQRAARAKGKRP